MNEQNLTPFLPGLENIVKPFRFPAQPYEYKVMPLRECPTPDSLQLCDTPQKAADYWRLHISTAPHFDPERECFAVLVTNFSAVIVLADLASEVPEAVGRTGI